MTTPLSAADFEVLAARSGLPLSDAQKATLLSIWPTLRAMLDRISAPLPREAEPGLIFQPEVRR